MRFKIDENIHPEVVETLRAGAHDVATVWDQGMRGASDDELAEALLGEQRALLTFDLGFADIRRHSPGTHGGIVVLRLAAQDRESQQAAAVRVCALLDREALNGRLWIVEDHRVRIRGA